MKKFLFRPTIVMLIVFVSAGLFACSSDDEDNNDTGNVKSMLIGTWECEWDDDYDEGISVVTFRSNNTGRWQEYIYEGSKRILEEDEEFDYTYEESTENLKMVFGDEMETWHVDMITNNKMVLDGYVYTKK